MVPAVLTGGGGALLAIRVRGKDNRWRGEVRLIAAGVLLLALGLVAGMQGALAYKEAAYERKRQRMRMLERDEVIDQIRFRMEALEKCALGKIWLDWKIEREGGEPLPAGTLCDPALFVLSAPAAVNRPAR